MKSPSTPAPLVCSLLLQASSAAVFMSSFIDIGNESLQASSTMSPSIGNNLYQPIFIGSSSIGKMQ